MRRSRSVTRTMRRGRTVHAEGTRRSLAVSLRHPLAVRGDRGLAPQTGTRSAARTRSWLVCLHLPLEQRSTAGRIRGH